MSRSVKGWRRMALLEASLLQSLIYAATMNSQLRYWIVLSLLAGSTFPDSVLFM